MSLVLSVVRAVHFASLMVLFGSQSLETLFVARLAAPPASPLPRFLPMWLAVIALASAALWLVLFAAGLSDPATPFGPATLWLAANATLFGKVTLIRLALLGALVVVAWRFRAMGLRIALSAAALSTIALTGHAAAGGDPHLLWARAANDGVHLLAAGFWVGSLALLVALAIAHRAAPEVLLAPLGLFSRWGVVAVAALVVTGLLNTWLILFASGAPAAFGYIGLLTLKIVLAALMVALALTNRFGLTESIRKDEPAAAATLRVSMAVELATGFIIILIVGFLGTMTP